jgi:zinc protease
MNTFNKFLSIVLMLFLSSGIIAQTNLKPNDQIPFHKDLVYGKLDNGLTYYILKNSEPNNRGEFYLINNVGAVQETPAQNGLAHFTEHMCFNGTKNFEEKEIINYLESIGMKFGPEINAYTSFDETVYTLNKVPLEEKANIDTSLMILYEWSTNVAMTAEEIDAERGVIREEWRTRRGADFRLRVKYFKTLLEGSKYADHSIIGELDVIDNAPYDTLRAFYNTWYRPENQAIIAVGDFDVKEIENKIKTIL